MTLIDLIDESKMVLKFYRNVPLMDIPMKDLERFNLAWIIVQATLGQSRFAEFLLDNDIPPPRKEGQRCPMCGSFECGCGPYG